MKYWRMQLHPSSPDKSMFFAVQSVGSGLIGLDFKVDHGDMRHLDPRQLDSGESDFLKFATEMVIGDLVLVIVHHWPFALVEVSGEYNYISDPQGELGVWFRHFRRIKRERSLFFSDRLTNSREWTQHRMTDTIAELKDPTGNSYRLIDAWQGSRGSTG